MPKRKRKILYIRPYERGKHQCPVKVTPTTKGKVGIFALKKVECKRYIPRSLGKPAKYEKCMFLWNKKPKREIESWRFDPGRDPGTVTDDPMKWLNRSPHAFEWDCPEKVFVAGKRIKR